MEGEANVGNLDVAEIGEPVKKGKKVAAKKVPAVKAAPKATANGKAAPAKKAPAPPPAPAPTDRQHARRVAEMLKSAADPTRLQVLLILNGGETNVTELCTALGTTSQPAVSHHLSLLRHGGFILPRREGKHNYYGLTETGAILVRAIEALMGE